MTDDVIARARPFLSQCGYCDAGLQTACTCPPGDYRPVMLELVREIERLSGEVGQAYGRGRDDEAVGL